MQYLFFSSTTIDKGTSSLGGDQPRLSLEGHPVLVFLANIFGRQDPWPSMAAMGEKDRIVGVAQGTIDPDILVQAHS